MVRIGNGVSRDPCELYDCMRYAMRLCRWAGYFPVTGLDQVYHDRIRSSWKSLYTVYHIVTIAGQASMCFFSLIWFFDSEITINSISHIVFYVTGFVSALLIMRLARHWPELMRKAADTEQMTNIITHRSVRRTTCIAYVFMGLALVEHILCTIFNIKFAMTCLYETSITNSVLEDYVVFRMPYIFNYVPYTIFNAILSEFFCMQATFIWSFSDVMIICFSIYVTSYLQSLNRIIMYKKHRKSISWGQLREHYSRIASLVKAIDAKLNSSILLSLFTDLFFICLQLFHSLHRTNVKIMFCNDGKGRNVLSSPEYSLYYLYSFLFLLLKTLSLSLFTANIHAAAQEPILAVYDVPSSEYDMEVQRFQSQLRFTEIAFTGKVFTVTRNMVLQVIGTIITYELVLLQFSVAPDNNSWALFVTDNTSTTGKESVI